MSKKIGKRTKLIGLIFVAFVIIFGGALFGLAKFGIIDLGAFADPLYGSVHITVDPSNSSGGAAFFRNGVAVSAPGSWRNGSPYIYDIPSLQLGQYQYQFGMPGPNGQPCMGPLRALNHAWTSTVDTYPRFTCGTPPVTGTYSLDGYVTSPSGRLANARVYFDANSSKTAVTDSDGHYRLEGLPFQDYLTMANHSFTYSASGFITKTALKLQNDLHQNPGGIQAGGIFYNVNVRLEPDLPEYKVTGNVKGDDGRTLKDVTVEVVDKNLTGNPAIVSTVSKDAGTFEGNKNYLTEIKFSRANLENLYLRFTPTPLSGYSQREVRLLDPYIIEGTSLVGSGSDIYELKKIKDIVLSRASYNLYYKISTSCTDANLCPNRNTLGLIDKVPVIVAGQSGEQLSSNAYTPSSLSGVLVGIVSGSREITINATNSPNYIRAYTSKTEPIDVAGIQPTTVPGLGSVLVKTFTLDKNPAYIPQKDLFDFQGLITDPDGNPIQADVRVECKNFSNCATGFGAAKYRLSQTTKTTTNGSEQNFLFRDLKNIAKAGSGITELELTITKQGYFVDLDNDGYQSANENGTFKILQGDIQPPTTAEGKSLCKKNFGLKAVASSNLKISGTLKTKDAGTSTRVELKLVPIKADGSLDENGAVAYQNLTASYNGSGYAITDLRSKIDVNKDYMLLASPYLRTPGDSSGYLGQMFLVRFTNQTSIIIDFMFEKNNGENFAFTGYVQNVDNSGRITNLANAEVSATLNGFEINNAYTDPESKQYRMEFLARDLFDLNAPNGTESVVEVTGFNGRSWQASKHKTYKFTLRKGQGMLIRRDFQFYPSDAADVLPATKTVRINLTQQIKKFKETSSTSPTLIGVAPPTPIVGAKVQLVSMRADGSTGHSGYAIRSEERETDRNGVVTFAGYPREASRIVVQFKDGTYLGLKIEGGDSKLVIAADDDRPRTLNYYKLEWDTTALVEAADDINMQQGDPRWTTYPVDEFSSPTIGKFGCGLTSLAMAIKFYYPTKNDFVGRDPRQTMDPSVIAKIANRIRGGSSFLTDDSDVPVMNCYGQIVRELNRQFGTEVTSTPVSKEQADQYLDAGIPVLMWGRGNLGGRAHNEHAILAVGRTGSGMYIISDSSHNPGVYETSFEGFSLSVRCAITIPRSGSYFRSTNGRVSSSGIALAADSNTNARADSDYLVTANIGNDTAAKVQEVFLRMKRTGTADLLFKMNKNGDNYSYTIPKYLISNSFSYSLLAMNAFGAKNESEIYQVGFDRITWTPTVTLSRAFSALRFSVFNNRNIPSLLGTNLANAINRAYENFRTAFTRFLTLSNINQSDLVSVSGIVVNASDQRMQKVIVKIWEDAALSEDGTFSVANVKRGRVPVEVINQETNENYILPSPTIDASAPRTNMRIIVDDPLDIGALDARVVWRSVPASSVGDGTALKTGKIKLLRNALVEREINLATTSGRLKIQGLQVGTYTVKYFMPDGAEKEIHLTNGGKTFAIRRGQTTVDNVWVSDLSSFQIKITSPYLSNGAPVDCNIYWWGHLYITDTTGYRADWYRPPQNCTISYTMYPGRFSFQMIDNYGYNRQITPTYIDIPPAVTGAIYEVKL